MTSLPNLASLRLGGRNIRIREPSTREKFAQLAHFFRATVSQLLGSMRKYVLTTKIAKGTKISAKLNSELRALRGENIFTLNRKNHKIHDRILVDYDARLRQIDSTSEQRGGDANYPSVDFCPCYNDLAERRTDASGRI
jgi:hypothetical protein